MSAHQHLPGKKHRKPLCPETVSLKWLKEIMSDGKPWHWTDLRDELLKNPKVRGLHEGGNDTARGVFYQKLEQYTPGYKIFTGEHIFDRVILPRKGRLMVHFRLRK